MNKAAARKILDGLTHDHYMRFAEWLVFADHTFYAQEEDEKKVFWESVNEEILSLEEVYQYWQKSIN